MLKFKKKIQVFIDTRTNFQYTLTKAYSQEVIGGTLVKYQPNLSKRSRRTKAMFTIGGRVLNDIVVQIVPESKNAVSNFFFDCFFLSIKSQFSEATPIERVN